jgi:hypothetical protein
MQAAVGRPTAEQDDVELAACFATTKVSLEDIGVATEHWFLDQLRRRSRTYRPASQRAQPSMLPFKDVQLARGLRGGCDIRVQLASGDWHGLQVKTLSYVDGRSFQFDCTPSWSPNLLVAAADSSFQSFALLWARDSYGSRFCVTFGVETATERTGRIIWKSTPPGLSTRWTSSSTGSRRRCRSPCRRLTGG